MNASMEEACGPQFLMLLAWGVMGSSASSAETVLYWGPLPLNDCLWLARAKAACAETKHFSMLVLYLSSTRD